MAEITINQEYIVKINATTETELTDEEIKNLIPTLLEVLKELITEEITDGVGTVDVEPVKHGEWVYSENRKAHCSECGNEEAEQRVTPYCSNCGARMGGENE